METELAGGIVDFLTLRFVGEEKDGTALHELRAAHVAEVLQGLVGLSSDLAKAGVFGDEPTGSELLGRPAQQGSFLIEVLRIIQDNQEAIAAGAGAAGVPTLSQVIWWATRTARADVSDFEYLENGNVKVSSQDNTAPYSSRRSTYTTTPMTNALAAAPPTGSPLVRQRMDFLLLFSDRRRVVIEVDGEQRYASGEKASPDLYAQMVAEDRRLRLAGYEVYRFGGAELFSEASKAMVEEFFDQLAARMA